MRKIREVLRFRHSGFSLREIARSLDLGRSTVGDTLARADQAGLGWPLPVELDDTALERMLYYRAPVPRPGQPRPEPQWSALHQELRRKGVTRFLLWQEYRKDHPEGYGYSRFCELLQRFARTLNPSMRQVHRAAEKIFVDYSGMRPQIVDPTTGEITEVELFVGALGASGYTYAEATESQDLSCWIGAHQRMFTFFGGCSQILVPDNLKSGVTRPCRYEPAINRAYRDMASHYGAVVIPTRVRKPKDKSQASHCTSFRMFGTHRGNRRRSRNRFPGWATGRAPVGGSKRIIPRSSARWARSTPSLANLLAVVKCTPSRAAIWGTVSHPF